MHVGRQQLSAVAEAKAVHMTLPRWAHPGVEGQLEPQQRTAWTRIPSAAARGDISIPAAETRLREIECGVEQLECSVCGKALSSTIDNAGNCRACGSSAWTKGAT